MRQIGWLFLVTLVSLAALPHHWVRAAVAAGRAGQLRAQQGPGGGRPESWSGCGSGAICPPPTSAARRVNGRAGPGHVPITAVTSVRSVDPWLQLPITACGISSWNPHQ